MPVRRPWPLSRRAGAFGRIGGFGLISIAALYLTVTGASGPDLQSLAVSPAPPPALEHAALVRPQAEVRASEAPRRPAAPPPPADEIDPTAAAIRVQPDRPPAASPDEDAVETFALGLPQWLPGHGDARVTAAPGDAEPAATVEPPPASPETEPPPEAPPPPAPVRVAAQEAPPPPPARTPPPPPTATPRPAPTVAPPAAPAPSLGGLAQLLFDGQNRERAAAGLPALRLDAGLQAVAQRRAGDMASRGYFGHTSPTGETAFSLIDAAGISAPSAAENIGYNDHPDATSAASILAGFMASASHRANILSRTFTRVGVAVAVGANGLKYYAVVFAGP
jgi:uncharacterized protein YkwD